MLAFYIWSNTTLLNSVNLKINYFPADEADLYIRYNHTLSPKLLGAVVNSEYFSHVYFIDMPTISKEKVMFGKIRKLRSIFYHRAYKKYYNRCLTSLADGVEYEAFFTGGMWNDAIYLIDFFYKRNPSLRIHFFDEGERSYEGLEALLCTIITNNRRKKTIDSLFLGNMRRRYRRCVSTKIYLYSPQRYHDNEKIEAIQLPTIDENNPVCLSLYLGESAGINDAHLLRYEKRKFIYFSNYLVEKYEDTYDKAHNIITHILANSHGNDLIIKVHGNSSEHRINFAKQFENRCFVDREVFLFEAVLPQISVENKVLIARASTVLMNPKVLFNKEPYLIFTYKLHPFYHQYGDKTADSYVDALKNMYIQKEKIFAPNTLFELDYIIAKLSRDDGEIFSVDDESYGETEWRYNLDGDTQSESLIAQPNESPNHYEGDA